MTYRNLLKVENPKVRILVNASGYGKIGYVTDTTLENSIGMVELNCEALVKMTYLTIPYMVENSNIIQMASSAAFLPQPKFAIYAASKSFVLSFSRALNVELEDKKITVTAVCPGPVKTEFFDIAEQNYQIATYKKIFMSESNKVVCKALIDANNKKDMSVYSFSMQGLQILSKLLPQNILFNMIK